MHNPTEHVQEHVTHEAAHGHDHSHASAWITWAAMTAAILAAFAAVSSAMATKHLTESTLTRISANDKWNFFGQKSIKNSNIDTRFFEYNIALANASGGKLSENVEKQHKDDLTKRSEYFDKEKDDSMPRIQADATLLEELSKKHLETHETYEMSATMFHIAIAVVAISVVAKRKEFWFMSMVGGVVGLYFITSAYSHAPAHQAHEEHTAAAGAHAPAAGALHAPAAGEHAKPPEGAATPPAAVEHGAAEHAPEAPVAPAAEHGH